MTSNPRHRHDYREITPARTGAETADGNSRRRARTRDVLVTAAQTFIAEGVADPSIQAITERAGVGFGSFFNHFASKTELFEAAVERAFITADALTSEMTKDIANPLERIAMTLRLVGRLPEIDPTVARVIAYSPTDTFAMYSGYDLSIETAFEAAKVEGTLPRPDRAVMRNTFVWGALKHLVLLRVTGADHPVEWADEFAEFALTMLGIDADTAKRLAHGPLPEGH